MRIPIIAFILTAYANNDRLDAGLIAYGSFRSPFLTSGGKDTSGTFVAISIVRY